MHNTTVYNQMTKSEREVAYYLRDLGIFWEYEKPIYVKDENNRPRVWTPDFFLSQFNIYVEVCGSKEFDYEYRRKVYQKNGYQVIFLHLYKNDSRWKKHFYGYIRRISNNRLISLHELFKQLS